MGPTKRMGVDANLALLQNVSLVASYARTQTDGLTGNDESHQATFNYGGDQWGAQVGHLMVGDDFNPEIGFVRRSGFRQSRLGGRISPRPESISWIRQLSLQGNASYVENERQGFVETRDLGGRFQVDFENSDMFSINFTDHFENLVEDTDISRATIPAGRYSFEDMEVSYNIGQQRRASGSLALRRGTFYSGHVTALGLRRGRIEILPQLSVEPSVEFNWIDLPDLQTAEGELNQHVARSRLTYGVSPRMFISGLLQYNSGSDSVSGNLRLRWEWVPGSELFVVYTEDRNTDVLGRWSQLSNRGFVIKVNRLLRL